MAILSSFLFVIEVMRFSYYIKGEEVVLMQKTNKILKLTLAAMFLSLALVIPLLTGQIPQLGSILCLIHIPIFICGFVCGPKYGLLIGLLAPLLRNMLFSTPVLYPNAIVMAFELSTYGFLSGMLYALLNRKQKPNLFLSIVVLVVAMLVGRLVWGTIYYLLTLLDGSLTFTASMFLSSAFLTAWPGIILQIILIPSLIYSLENLNVLTKFTTRF